MTFLYEWQFTGNLGVHRNGLRVRFEMLPHGTRGADVVFQDSKHRRWVARPEFIPDTVTALGARKLMLKGAQEWMNQKI